MKFIPQKKHYAIAELPTRWGCKLDDVLQLIIDGELIPCIFLPEDFYQEGVVERSDDGELCFCPIHVDNAPPERIGGFQYLLWPSQTDVSDCKFQLFSYIGLQPSEGTYCYSLNEPIALDYVTACGVVLSKEVERFESKRGAVKVAVEDEKPLMARERNTLLTIIAALCKEAKIDIGTPSKAGQLIESITDSMGTPVAKRTIEEHLKKIPDALEARMK